MGWFPSDTLPQIGASKEQNRRLITKNVRRRTFFALTQKTLFYGEKTEHTISYEGNSDHTDRCHFSYPFVRRNFNSESHTYRQSSFSLNVYQVLNRWNKYLCFLRSNPVHY